MKGYGLVMEKKMLTADTITDEQIRDLHDWARRRDVRDFDLLTDTQIALGLPVAGMENHYSPSSRAVARARCAEILNSRKV